VDNRGRVHVVDTGNNRIQIFEENHHPDAAMETLIPPFGLTAEFTSISTDDDAVVEALWDFGDDTTEITGTAAPTKHTYPSEGTWRVTLTVKDAQGLASQTLKEITVVHPPDFLFNRTGFEIAPGISVDLSLTGANGLETEFTLSGPGTLSCKEYQCSYTSPDQPGENQQATVTAFLTEAPKIRNSAVVYLQSRVVTGMVSNPQTLSFTQGKEQQVTVTAYYSDGSTGEVTQTVDWKVNPDSLATVEDGIVNPMDAGNGSITASFSGQTLSIPFTIEQSDPDAGSHGATGARAIVIAAGGVAKSNTLWPHTNELTFDFYRMMLSKGLKQDDIYFLSFSRDHDLDNNGVADPIERDLDVTFRTIEWAFEWAQKNVQPEKPLFIYISGHGGDGVLELNRKTGENITGEQLQGLLNRIPGDVPVVLFVEACYSGSLIKTIAGPNRVIITSSAEDEAAYFIVENSFSREFIKASRQLTDLQQAFDLASRRLAMDYRGSAEQHPQLDDNGDGSANTSMDGAAARTIPYGYRTAAVPPTIIATSGAREITGDSSEIWVKVHSPEVPVQTVKAIILPPDYAPPVIGDNGPLLPDLKEVQFTWSSSRDRWEALPDNLEIPGRWRFKITADAGSAGKDFGDIVLTKITLDQGGGDTPSEEPDPTPSEESITMEITTSSPVYTRGDELVIQSHINGDGKYNLYYAIILPTGDFITFHEDETLSSLNEITPYKEGMVIDENRLERVLTIPLLPDLIPGDYTVLGVVTGYGENIFETGSIVANGATLFEFIPGD